jgi:predicted dehydrogenase
LYSVAERSCHRALYLLRTVGVDESGTRPSPTLIVGFGNMGAKHARVLRELGGPGALFGVVDPAPERRRRASEDYGCAAFESIAAALADGAKRPACAVVAAPTPLHAALGRELLAARVPTLMEKPIAASAAEGQALVELAAASGTALTVGHVERFNPAVVAARKLVADRVIGDTLQICFRRVGGSPLDAYALQDVLSDLAVHDFDLAQYISGGALHLVEALGHEEQGRFDSALVLGRLSTGAAMLLQVNWRTPVKIRRIELTGTRGYVEINLITQEVTLYRQNPLLAADDAISPEALAQYADYLKSFASPDRVELGINRLEPLQEQLRAFWRALATGAAAPVPGPAAVDAVRLTEEARRLLAERHG